MTEAPDAGRRILGHGFCRVRYLVPALPEAGVLEEGRHIFGCRPRKGNVVCWDSFVRIVEALAMRDGRLVVWFNYRFCTKSCRLSMHRCSRIIHSSSFVMTVQSRNSSFCQLSSTQRRRHHRTDLRPALTSARHEYGFEQASVWRRDIDQCATTGFAP